MQNDDADLPTESAPFIVARLRTASPARQRLTATAREVLGQVG